MTQYFIRFVGLIYVFITCSLLYAEPQIILIEGEQMRINLHHSSVSKNGDTWDIILYMANDNDTANGVLPNSFRRWWHVTLDGLDPSSGEVLNIRITNAGYSDKITPVWSLDDGITYERIPGHFLGNYQYTGDHLFQITVPPDISSIRLSKYFPATLSDYDAFRNTIQAHPHVFEEIIGYSEQNRPIYMQEITNKEIPPTEKIRVWIHSTVHPAENTAYFNCEGLIDWLLSGTPLSEAALNGLIFNIVPRANPDGVYVGNYRTNVNNVNLENEFAAPYQSTAKESQSLISTIEYFMGTTEEPGENPIYLLLNLHSSHGASYPFHFVHVPDYNINGTGVIPEVYDLEIKWTQKLNERSPYVRMGTNRSSSLTGRPFVESMMHDRYTLEEEWDPIMAITFEGTYEAGPISGIPNTPDDYRQVGKEIGMAIADYFEIEPLPTYSEHWYLFQ